jgi:hypothetical protein
MGVLGITGATMAAASIGVLVAGTLNLTTGPFDRRFSSPVRDTRRSGRALVGLGLVGVAAGITALAFDLALRRRARAHHRVRVHADVTPNSGGIWLSGRF